MEIYDNRERRALIEPPYGKIIKLEGSSGSGSVSAILSEGYTVTVDYKEIEDLFNAMIGYTGKLRWGEVNG